MRERISRQGGRVGRRGRARLVRLGLEALGLLPWACDLLGCVWPWGGGLGMGGRPCPLACAAAWAVRPAPGPACVHVCMGALVCRPAAWAMPAASGHNHTPGGPHPARRPCPPCRRSAARLLPCPRPRPAARPAADPAGPAPCDMATAAPEGFYAPGLVSRRSKLSAPLYPPNYRTWHRKSPRKFLQKNFPTSPVGGNGGTVFGLLTAQKNAAIIRGKRRPTGRRPANRHRPHGHRDQKGEVNMTTPTASELLVQQAREAERLRLLLLASECKDLDEFRQRLLDLLNK